MGYVAWSHAVVEGLRGVSAPLENALDTLFEELFYAGDRDRLLARYYKELAGENPDAKCSRL